MLTGRPDLSTQRVFDGLCETLSDAELAYALQIVRAHWERAQTRLVLLTDEQCARQRREYESKSGQGTLL